jgi:type I restriction enzyme S subunit
LGELVEELTIRNNIGASVWSVTNDRGFVLSEENFSERVASKDISNYKLVSPQDFAYSPPRINVGSINYNNSEKTGCVSPIYIVFKVRKQEKIVPQYLFCLFQSEKFKEQVKSFCFGSVRQSLSFENFAKIVIPVPSLAEQKKVVDELKKIKENIQNAQKTIDNLNSSLSLSLSLCFEKEIKIKKLDEFATFEYGYTTKADNKGEYRFIQTGDIDKHGNILEQEKYINLPNGINEDKYLLKKEDIITARHGNCGRTAIFQGKEKSIFTNDLIKVNLNREMISPKFYWVFTQTWDY